MLSGYLSWLFIVFIIFLVFSGSLRLEIGKAFFSHKRSSSLNCITIFEKASNVSVVFRRAMVNAFQRQAKAMLGELLICLSISSYCPPQSLISNGYSAAIYALLSVPSATWNSITMSEGIL